MVKLGCSIEEIDTPALIIDLDILEMNIELMAKKFSKMPSELRPHSKTHKLPIIAHKQLKAGAIGITCAKLGEAEIMVNAGITDLLIANQIVGEPKVTRLINLAKHSDVIVAVDKIENVRHLANKAREKRIKLNLLVEIDVGNNRCGTLPGKPTLELAKEITKYPNLNLRGLMGYEGFCQFMLNMEEKKEIVNAAMKKLISTRELLEDYGFNIEIISAGGTGTHMISGQYPGVTEIEAGSYVFMDARYSKVPGLEKFDNALTILSTIISTPKPEKAVCDAGFKTITFENGMPPVKGRKDIVYERPNEEHGHLKILKDSKQLLGEKIEFYPTHCCTNINLYDFVHGVRDGYLESIWRIHGRGKSQ